MMRIGMLWFDDSPNRPLGDKIQRAATYYESKYGRSPNACYVHSSCLSDANPIDVSVKVLGIDDLLPFHFWLGVMETPPVA